MSRKPQIPMLDLVRLHAPLKPALMRTFEEVLDSGRFIGGERVAAFETAFAAGLDVDYCVGMSSGTDALLAVLLVLGVGPGDEVITSGYSFFATAGSIARLGATPVFVDIDPDTFNIDPSAVQAAITPRTVGIVPVHLFGQCADMARILAIAKERGLFVVEDAAQSLGAAYQGRPAGTLGTAGVFSFFPAKNLGAFGDAGAVVTNDAALCEQLAQVREHGAVTRYHHEQMGGNFRLDALQAALLNVKLPHLKTWEKARIRIAETYRAALEGVPGLRLPVVRSDCTAVYNQFVVRSPHRDRIRDALSDAGIASAVYYPEPLYRQPCFKNSRYTALVLPNCDRASAEALAIPVDPGLEAGDVARISEVVKSTLSALDRARRVC